MSITSPPDQLEAIRSAVREICAGHSVSRLELFGSVARAESADSSDIDFLVEFLPDAHVGLFEMGALHEALEEKLGRRVDLLSRAAVEKSRNAYRRGAILADAVLVYP